MIYTFINEIQHYVYYVKTSSLNEYDTHLLETLLDAEYISESIERYIIIGPIRKLISPYSSHITTLCHELGLQQITRVEKAKLYRKDSKPIYDPLLEEIYPDNFNHYDNYEPLPSFHIPLTSPAVLENIQRENGWGWDKDDINYIYTLFHDKLKRDPTFTELMDLAQSNNEHSRHWFFNGNCILDGKPLQDTLFQLVKKPYKAYPQNSVIAFSDNASAQTGFKQCAILNTNYNTYQVYKQYKQLDITLTAETHNFPTGVSPFPGASTGVGGRLRDQHAAGKGSLFGAGLSGYCVGAIPKIPGQVYDMPKPSSMEDPTTILIEASNGASDYGNKFGEPLIGGFTRSYAHKIGDQYISWSKPIMFSAGVGHIYETKKETPAVGDVVVKLGGPAYRVGLGGGSSSSLTVQGEIKTQRDEQAVQRGDPEMEQKLNRVIRACVETEDGKSIFKSIHDQGAGGNGNVVKELVYPTGATIHLDKLNKGDTSLSPWECWSAEYQESDAVLVDPSNYNLLDSICRRENTPCNAIGFVDNHKHITVLENKTEVVDLPLKDVLGDLPPKTFILETISRHIPNIPFKGTDQLSILLHKIWLLPSVCSKRFLTTKVDRSVTGLVAQQQCVGPLHLPLSNVAVKGYSFWSYEGVATAIGEQPIKGLLDPAAGARMSVGECLTNLVWAQTSGMSNIKVSGNWMWPAKVKGEGARMVKAVQALSNILINLGLVLDGGKDSLSMAVNYSRGNEHGTIIAPGNIVVTAYAKCPDIRKTVQPVLKSKGSIWLLPLSHKTRTGGSAWAQSQGHLGGECPDVDHPKRLLKLFETIQELIRQDVVLAGHDRSDGGLITCLMEMAFAGNVGFKITCPTLDDVLPFLLNEEIGVVIQVDNSINIYNIWEGAIRLGESCEGYMCTIEQQDTAFYWSIDLRYGRAVWEETSFMLEKKQAHPGTVLQEQANSFQQVGMNYHNTVIHRPLKNNSVPMAVIRAEGCNGDQELQAAFMHAGFTVFDIHMNDLKHDDTLCTKIGQGYFKGLAFSGGFSYADVLGAGKGWAYTITESKNKLVTDSFRAFKQRTDVFSLGVCNGCQLLSRMGWVNGTLKENISQRFECRFSAVKITDDNNIFFRGMKDKVLGVWLAHKEGRFGNVSNSVLKYVDTDHEETQMYPFNPNGSEKATAGVLSNDGRHLALMPHPERSFLSWQWPQDSKKKCESTYTPWIQLFDNLYVFAKSE